MIEYVYPVASATTPIRGTEYRVCKYMFPPPGPDADVEEIYTLLDVLVVECAVDLVVPILGLILD